jgi:hypothetical protein
VFSEDPRFNSAPSIERSLDREVQRAPRSGGVCIILSHPLAFGSNAKTTTVPTQTYEVNSVQSMQPKNHQQLGGKKKRNKNNNSNIEQGTAPIQNNQAEGTKENKKNPFPCMICREDHPTHKFP